jgi:hypothetical protein
MIPFLIVTDVWSVSQESPSRTREEYQKNSTLIIGHWIGNPALTFEGFGELCPQALFGGVSGTFGSEPLSMSVGIHGLPKGIEGFDVPKIRNRSVLPLPRNSLTGIVYTDQSGRNHWTLFDTQIPQASICGKIEYQA